MSCKGGRAIERITCPPIKALVRPVHIHADVDVVHEVAAAGNFKLSPSPVCIHATENNLAASQWLRLLFPLTGEATDKSVGLQAKDHHTGDMELGRRCWYIDRPCTHQAVEVRFFNDIIIVDDVTLKSDVGQLLHQMRAAASQANESHGAFGNPFFRIRAEERLTVVTRRAHLTPLRENTPIGFPMTWMVVACNNTVCCPGATPNPHHDSG